MVALLTDSFGLKSSKLAQLDSTKFDEEPSTVRNEYSVPETPSLVRDRPGVPKTAS